MNTMSTSSPDLPDLEGNGDRRYDPAHGAPYAAEASEPHRSAWAKLGRFGFRRRWF